MNKVFLMLILLSVTLTNQLGSSDYLEPAYFKPSKKPKELPIEQIQNTKYYEMKDGQPADIFELKDNLLEESHEYGFAFWMRFQEEQSRDDFYFLSRLTTNSNHGDQDYYGDRTLSVFLYRSQFIYATYDLDEQLKSKERSIKLRENINGNWYFICYSKRETKIVGFLVKFGGQQFERFEQYGRHVPSKYYKIIIGGSEFKYKEIKGQFANIFFDFDGPAFVDSEQDVQKIIKQHCNMPQVLLKQKIISIIKEPKKFTPSDTLEIQPFEDNYIFTQYSVKGWYKWTDIKVEEQVAFNIFNLKSTPQQSRTLEILQQIGGGSKHLIHFNTYSIIEDQELITKSVDSNELVWTQISFAYDIGSLKAFGYVISPGSVQSILFEQVQHKQVKKLYLTVASLFNGQIAHFYLNVGPNSFNENLILDEDGAASLYLQEKRVTIKEEIVTSRYDSIQAVYNQVYDDEQVNGQSEYSFGMWSRWIRTYPIYVRKRSEIHSIANLRRQYSQLLLELNLNQEQYMFKSKDQIQFIPQLLEGTWTYLYFGYIRLKGKALGVVNFEGNNLKTVEFDVFHDLIYDQIQFYVGKHQVPAFNGEFARIKFQFGPGAFTQEGEFQNISPKGLPFTEPIPRKTIQLIGALTKSPIEEQFEFQQFQSIKEYSISGWVKFNGKERSGEQFHIITLTQRRLEEIDNQITLQISKNDLNYLFATYTCDLNCDKIIQKGSLFGEYWDQWTYMYFGYKHDQTYSYIEYTFTDDQFTIQEVKHYYMSVFSILIGQLGDLLSFSGSLKQWVLNIGDGAYKEGGYKDENTSVKVHFGYESGSDHFEQARTIKDHGDLLNCESKIVHFEQSDTLNLDGICEYGYGMWIQFKHYANKIIYEKPKLMGIAKFSISSVENLLNIIMTVGNYQFISMNENSLEQYDTYHESDWVFLYYAYKRQSHEQGNTRGFIVDHIGIRVIEQQIIHPLLRDHLDFIVGNAGKNYPQFNGIITGVRVYLGPASLMTEEQVKQMLNKINPKPSQIFVDSFISITEGHQKYEGDNPITIEGESNQYSIQLWFKINTGSFLYRLTQNLEPQDYHRIGDRVFHLINTENSMIFSTYSLQKEDAIQAKIQTQCSIDKYDSQLWAFVYQAYSKMEKSMITYFKVEDRVCEQTINVIHAISEKMWLYLYNDYTNNLTVGKFTDIKFNLGKGSYTNEYNKLSGYIAGNIVSPKVLKEIDIISESREIFTEVDSMSEYSISMWMKFSSTFPKRLYKKSELYQIFRMTHNQIYQEGIIKAGDRMLSAYVTTNSISFNSYDINDDNPNEFRIMEIERLENRWIFLYAGYKRQLQVAKYYVFEKQEKTISNENLLQNPLEDYVAVIFDKEDGVSQFNGILAQIAISLGVGSFGQSGSFLNGKLSDYMIQYQLPNELTLEYLYGKKAGIVKLEESVEEEYYDIGSYSVCGWFKLDYQPLSKFQADQSCITIARVYENEQLNDKLLQGDRSLFIQVCDQQFVRFQTYTLNEINSINEHKLIEQSIEMDSPQIWHYVYMGYDDLKGEVNILMKQFDADSITTMNGVWHMETNFIGILFGQELNRVAFQGQLQEWSFIYGQFIDMKNLPAYNLITNNIKQQYSGEETSHVFDNAVNEYSIGVWTRWLSEYYDCKAVAFHNIFRLTSNKQYSDRSQFGDRVLFSYLTNKNYEFSTYDKKQKLPAVNAQIPYEYIEGEWTYIYFAYKNCQIFGLIIHKDQEKAEHITLNVEHDILAYAKLIMRQAEFGFQDFKGDLFDLRVFLGANSFLDDSSKVLNMINKIHLKIPKVDLKVEKFYLETDYESTSSEKFEKEFPYEQQTKYSIECWLSLERGENLESQQGILKLTTEINQNTLILLRKANSITFGTYSFKKKIVPLWQSQEIPTEEWIHVYFGYSENLAQAYLKSSVGIWEYTFNVRHVVPKSFKFQMANFDSFEQYKGSIKNVHVTWNEPIEIPEETLLSHQ